MIEWYFLPPVLLCALAAILCGHETLIAARRGEFTVVGAVLPLACAISTFIAFGAVFK